MFTLFAQQYGISLPGVGNLDMSTLMIIGVIIMVIVTDPTRRAAVWALITGKQPVPGPTPIPGPLPVPVPGPLPIPGPEPTPTPIPIIPNIGGGGLIQLILQILMSTLLKAKATGNASLEKSTTEVLQHLQSEVNQLQSSTLSAAIK